MIAIIIAIAMIAMIITRTNTSIYHYPLRWRLVLPHSILRSTEQHGYLSHTHTHTHTHTGERVCVCKAGDFIYTNALFVQGADKKEREREREKTQERDKGNGIEQTEHKETSIKSAGREQ